MRQPLQGRSISRPDISCVFFDDAHGSRNPIIGGRRAVNRLTSSERENYVVDCAAQWGVGLAMIAKQELWHAELRASSDARISDVLAPSPVPQSMPGRKPSKRRRVRSWSCCWWWTRCARFLEKFRGHGRAASSDWFGRRVVPQRAYPYAATQPAWATRPFRRGISGNAA